MGTVTPCAGLGGIYRRNLDSAVGRNDSTINAGKDVHHGSATLKGDWTTATKQAVTDDLVTATSNARDIEEMGGTNTGPRAMQDNLRERRECLPLLDACRLLDKVIASLHARDCRFLERIVVVVD